MIHIDNPYTDPYFNLAAEEYLFHTSNENIFMLWQNDPVVVIGKHQDAAKEINKPLAKEKNIRLVRRLTGGGAVYQDQGNFNLTLIGNRHTVANDKLLKAIRNFLHSLQISAWIDERKNICINRFKISGSAQGVYKDRWLYHATLLFSSDLAILQSILQPDNPFATISQLICVESVKSPVTNIRDYLPDYISIYQFKQRLMEYMISFFPFSQSYIFTPKDLAAIYYLKENKYATNLWNYRISSFPYPVASI
ncbi:lipoate--protein ligase family protein [Parabacteroides pacaensis]|uniref:lipoate--protein ligase family protein n=1 Tax=Parabacteroides pacaensis TaxID=2086575 RepID=UPI000D0FA725|nr:lipoate--protein ligase family protein [Parabacteroides pacaensis]